ncbi:DUF4399 domain-containing protein [Herbaspirillum huttiense]|uniref:DUF4399 domain-containing protein n=1 Tax=Herbaspirillum huttiense TaxID=863372 RepID=UPI00288BDB84|nr:DUF4399 domain-containing protein [Herbaspirillum huttiense]
MLLHASKFCAAGLSIALAVGAPYPAVADEPTVQILEPKSGATVVSPFKVRLTAHSKTTSPSYDKTANSGHHHLLINQAQVASGKRIPTNSSSINLNQGQTEVLVTLPPGTYRLTAQFGDADDRSYGFMMSHGITVTVK